MSQKIVLITGASSGIGKATAKTLIEKGYTVYAAARREEKMNNLKDLGCIPVKMDITKEEDIQAVVNQIETEHGGVDILVNNAGFGMYGAMEDITINANEKLPGFLVATESVFLVHLIRLATREHIIPFKILTQEKLNHEHAYTDFFGTNPELGQKNQITFSAKDAQCPFLTENESMWQFFEPELRRKLAYLNADDSFAIRVHSTLLELLPTGQSSIEDVSNKLGVSKRTLQRRLQEESTSFKTQLNQTREKLARYYLANSNSSGTEISFLLGFDDPNSFFRAFNTWTGTTPESFRQKTINSTIKQ